MHFAIGNSVILHQKSVWISVLSYERNGSEIKLIENGETRSKTIPAPEFYMILMVLMCSEYVMSTHYTLVVVV